MGVCKNVASNTKPSNCFLSIADESLLSQLALCDVAAESYYILNFSVKDIYQKKLRNRYQLCSPFSLRDLLKRG